MRCLAGPGPGFRPAPDCKTCLQFNLLNHYEKGTMNGTPVYGERVVIVEVDSGHVNLRTGCISSTESSHVHADNLRTTVVRGDKEFHPMPGNPEAYERKFNVDDIHLLKAGEAESLRDSAAAQQWFGDIYEDPVVRKIQRAIKSLLRK